MVAELDPNWYMVYFDGSLNKETPRFLDEVGLSCRLNVKPDRDKTTFIVPSTDENLAAASEND